MRIAQLRLVVIANARTRTEKGRASHVVSSTVTFRAEKFPVLDNRPYPRSGGLGYCTLNSVFPIFRII